MPGASNLSYCNSDTSEVSESTFVWICASIWIIFCTTFASFVVLFLTSFVNARILAVIISFHLCESFHQIFRLFLLLFFICWWRWRIWQHLGNWPFIQVRMIWWHVMFLHSFLFYFFFLVYARLSFLSLLIDTDRSLVYTIKVFLVFKTSWRPISPYHRLFWPTPRLEIIKN